ncbi:SPFH domain-containing protein [Nocardia tengchongensis]|uniref:SPFH domain-containing protein n=1 Tax=Nocardia tengchongensis TaxID=2055889 RepID=UPI003678C204
MAWFEREFVAVPDAHRNQLVYQWPDHNLRRFSRAIVAADQTALFVKTGRVLATLGPGRHRIDADELPVLGALVDTLTGGNYYRTELYFVSSREFPGLRFGGRLADILDPVSGQIVSLRAFGEFALTVRDPAMLITTLNATTDPQRPDSTGAWCAELLLKSMKIAATQSISEGRWPVLGLPAHLAEIEAAVVRLANRSLYQYGLRIPRLGNFDITLAPEDAERLKRLAKDTTYIELAGDFGRYAVGELALGASKGLAAAHGSGEFLSTALGFSTLAPNLSATPWQRPGQLGADAALTSTDEVCTHCQARLSPSVLFCTQCGTAVGRTCRSCGRTLGADARFCGGCGTAAP